jgi:hypothetical protein
MVEVSVPCGACGKPVRGGDEFCEACGAQVAPELKAALRARLEASDLGFALHAKQVRNAQSTIGVLSVLFVLGGALFFFITKGQADDALAKLAGASDTAPLAETVAGASTVGELRAALAREPYQVLGLNLFLAVVMLGLWFWSKRALLPAIIAAFGIYVTVIVGSALVDPKTLVQGIIVKIAVIVALSKGVQSALAARKLETAR